MGLTKWSDILNKPKAIEEVDELALKVSDLSASVLSIAGDVGELELSVSDLSASVLSISEDLGEVAEDVQEIAFEVSQLSASILPMSAEDPTTIKNKIDSNNHNIVISGYINAFRVNDNRAICTFPVPADITNPAVALSNYEIEYDIYGDKGFVGASATATIAIANSKGHWAIYLDDQNVNLSNYVSSYREFVVLIRDKLIATISETNS